MPIVEEFWAICGKLLAYMLNPTFIMCFSQFPDTFVTPLTKGGVAFLCNKNMPKFIGAN